MKVAFAVACAAMIVPGGATAGSPQPSPADQASRARPALVRTDSGWLRGQVEGDHHTFSGVPYAAPPTGRLRWAPPRRPSRWRGVRDATEPAAVCPQWGTDSSDERVVVGGEDCLYLNVTVPATRRSQRRLPVLVWIHGGYFVSGAGSEYDGAALATEGDVMVVTINYRLGALGFLSAPALDTADGAAGGYGIADQIAALRWVRRNASRFGGDASNVTIAGQSAGGRSVCVHLASPMSRGLFDRAIIQSAACANPLATKPAADARGNRVIAEVGCSDAPDIAECLRTRPVADLLATLPGVGAPINDRTSDDPWGPVPGTSLLPEQPIDAIAAGSAADVALLIGSTRDETRPFVGFRYDAVGRPLTDAGYRDIVADTFAENADIVLERYPAVPTPALALSSVLTDWGGSIGACPVLATAQAAARHAPVFEYELSEDSGQVVNDFPLGAYHGWDLHFLWRVSIAGNDPPALTPQQQALGKQMRGYWSAFAHTGDPNGANRPPWPTFDRNEAVLGLSTTRISPIPFADIHHCDFWAGR